MRTDATKSELLANISKIISHDLRSHSSNVLLLLEAIKLSNNYVGDDEMLKMLNKSANSISRTIDNLYEVISIHTKSDLKKESIALSQFVREIIFNFKSDKNVADTIQNKVNDDIGVFAVPHYLENSIITLLNTAIDNATVTNKSMILVSATEVTNGVEVSIQDNGVGYNMNLNQNKVFNMYLTSNAENKTKDIGLFLSKNQIETMGGKLSVESVPDEQTTFTIFLPHE